MTATSTSELASFLQTGVYNLLNDGDDLRVVFLDPVRLLNDSYTRFSVSASSYYSRSFRSQPNNDVPGKQLPSPSSSSAAGQKKRKRRRKIGGGARVPNEREIAAERRHQEARSLLMKAHEALLRAMDLLSVLPELARGDNSTHFRGTDGESDFVQLGSLWQAPLYEISFCVPVVGDCFSGKEENSEKTSVQIFDNFVSNELDEEMEAEFLNNYYILPRKSNFYMVLLKKDSTLLSLIHLGKMQVQTRKPIIQRCQTIILSTFRLPNLFMPREQLWPYG